MHVIILLIVNIIIVIFWASHHACTFWDGVSKNILKPEIKFVKILNHLLNFTNSSFAVRNENATVVISLQ